MGLMSRKFNVGQLPTGSYSISGSFSGSFVGDGSGIQGITATAEPAGPVTSVQFNDGLNVSGSSQFTFNKVTGVATVTSSFAITASHALNSGGSSTDTGSLLTTASVSLNTITFTKGDSTTFPITIDTGSGGASIPEGTVSGSAQISELGFVTSSATSSFVLNSQTSSMSVLSSSYAVTASFALNAGGGGSVDTGSLLTTASVSLNTITFTKGDGSTFPITVDTGSGGGGGVPSGTVSSSAQITELGFVTSSATASFVLNSQTSSMSVATASYVDFTNIDNVPTLVSGSSQISYTGITDIPVGILSSSAQIATDISGAFTADSASFDSRITTNASNISTLTAATSSYVLASQTSSMSVATASYVAASNIDGTVSNALSSSHAQRSNATDTIDVTQGSANTNRYVTFTSAINSDGALLADPGILYNPFSNTLTVANITGTASLASAAESVEYSNVNNKPTLISSSAQIATEISGAFVADSASFSTRITSNETNIASLTTATSSYVLNSQTSSMSVATASYVETAQTASYVLQAVSASYAPTAPGILSSSAQIATDISGAFNADSASFSTRITTNENDISTLTAATASYILASQTSSMSVATASYVETAQTASYVVTAQTASYVISSSIDGITNYVRNDQTSSMTVLSSSFAITASHALNAGGGTPTFIASGSTSASAAPNTGVVVEHSGSTAFSVIGDVGTLFSVDDDLNGMLFTANDISGFPVLQASASGEVYIGKTPQSLYTTAVISSTTAAITHSLCTLSTSSYDGAFFEYTAQSASNARAGNIMSTWNGTDIVYAETTTADIGRTSDLTTEVIISGSTARLIAYGANAGYKIKTIIKAI
jgi:hypothetical protein